MPFLQKDRRYFCAFLLWVFLRNKGGEQKGLASYPRADKSRG